MIRPQRMSPAGLYMVTKKNPYWPTNTFVRRFDDGYERCVVDSDRGRLEILGYTGVVLPPSTGVGQFLTKIQKQGLDMGSARMDRRRIVGD